MLSLLRFERKQNNYSNPFRIRIFLFLSYSFGIKTISTFIQPVFPRKPYPIPDQNGKSVYLFSDQNGAQNPTRWGGTYLYSLYKGVPPGGFYIVTWLNTSVK